MFLLRRLIQFVRDYFNNCKKRKVLRTVIKLQHWLDDHPREDMRYNDYLQLHFNKK